MQNIQARWLKVERSRFISCYYKVRGCFQKRDSCKCRQESVILPLMIEAWSYLCESSRVSRDWECDTGLCGHNGADADHTICSETSMPGLCIKMIGTDRWWPGQCRGASHLCSAPGHGPRHPSLIVFTRQLLTPGPTLPDTETPGPWLVSPVTILASHWSEEVARLMITHHFVSTQTIKSIIYHEN